VIKKGLKLVQVRLWLNVFLRLTSLGHILDNKSFFYLSEITHLFTLWILFSVFPLTSPYMSPVMMILMIQTTNQVLSYQKTC